MSNSSEEAWFKAVMGVESASGGDSFCADCDGHADENGELSRHGDPYLPVETGHPHYEGPGYRWLPVNGKMKSYYFPLNEVRWLTTQEANLMREDDPVVAVSLGGGAWAFPWWVMKNHHVANLCLDGNPALIMFCEACTSAAMFDPVLDGRRLNFRLDAVYNGAISTIDLETKSAWTGFTGESYFGPLRRRRLPRLPIVQSTWAQWKRDFPHTLVVDGTGERRDGHGARHFPGSTMETNVTKNALHFDARIPGDVLVLGVEIGARSRCYPLSELSTRGPVLHDTFANEDLVIFSKPEVWRALAFKRMLDGRRLTFQGEGDLFVDDETGSCWDLFGRAVEGPLKGCALEYVHSGVEKYAPWVSFHLETEIFPSSEASPVLERLRCEQKEKWEERWTSADYTPIWDKSGDLAILRSALSDGWLQPGMKVLDVGCGEGEMVEWLAERGLRVMGVDISGAVIERAAGRCQGVQGTKFLQLDVCAEALRLGPFDAITDRGCLHIIPDELQGAYAQNIIAWSRPGTHFQLMMHCRNGYSAEERRALVNHLFSPDFRLVGMEKFDMSDPQKPDSVPGCAFRLERQ